MANLSSNISNPSNPTCNKYRFVIAALIMAGHMTVGLNIFAVSPLIPMTIEEYGINRTTAGLLVAMPLMVTAAMGIPSGILIARIGLHRSFIIGWAALALVSLSGFAPNFVTLLLLRTGIGLGFAFIITATGPLLMQWFRPKEIMMMNALTTAALSLGIALSVGTAATLATMMDWQMALVIFAIPGTAGLVAWTLLNRSTDGTTITGRGISLLEVVRVLRNRSVMLLLIADAGILVQYTAFTGWLPTFYNENRGIPLSQAGFITGTLPFVGVFAVLAGGAISLRVTSPRTLFVTSGLLAGVGGLGAFLMPELGLIYPSVVLLGIGSWLYVPTLLTLPIQMRGMTPERVAVVWGAFLTFSGFAMFISPILVGAFKDISGSFFPGLAVCAIASWSLLFAGFLLPTNVNQTTTRTTHSTSD